MILILFNAWSSFKQNFYFLFYKTFIFLRTFVIPKLMDTLFLALIELLWKEFFIHFYVYRSRLMLVTHKLNEISTTLICYFDCKRKYFRWSLISGQWLPESAIPLCLEPSENQVKKLLFVTAFPSFQFSLVWVKKKWLSITTFLKATKFNSVQHLVYF